MKPPLILSAILFALLTTSSCAYESGGVAAKSSAASNMAAAADSEALCLPDPSWFKAGQPAMPSGQGVTEFCNFHQWSWQMFLYLTDVETDPTQGEITGEPRFLSWLTPNQVLRGQDTSLAFDERLQAGSDAMLVDKNGRLVYYSQYLNDEFVQFMQSIDQSTYGQFKSKGSLLPELPLSAGFAKKFEEVLNKNNAITFPINAIELKASWMIVPEGESNKYSGYYQMPAKVTPLKNVAGGKIDFDNDAAPLEVTVAMVGLHIGGVVEGHPEMVWASFENIANAPNEPQNRTPSTVISEDDFTFYSANTTSIQCNQIAQSPGQLTLNEANQVLTPSTEVCRQYALGSDPTIQNMRVDQNIRDVTSMNTAALLNFGNEINSCKATKSIDQNCDRAELWQNYFEVGAIWFSASDALAPGMTLATDCYVPTSSEDNKPKDPAASVGCPDSFVGTDVEQLLIGSLVLSNATIETFTQNGTSENNCFRCHNTTAAEPEQTWQQPLKASNLNISHAFKNLYFRSQVNSAAQ